MENFISNNERNNFNSNHQPFQPIKPPTPMNPLPPSVFRSNKPSIIYPSTPSTLLSLTSNPTNKIRTLALLTNTIPPIPPIKNIGKQETEDNDIKHKSLELKIEENHIQYKIEQKLSISNMDERHLDCISRLNSELNLDQDFNAPLMHPSVMKLFTFLWMEDNVNRAHSYLYTYTVQLCNCSSCV